MRHVAVVVAALSALACGGMFSGTPVPPEHVDLIGDWTGPHHHLSVTPEGTVSYEYKEGSVSSSVNGGVTSWASNEFTVLGVSTFHVQEPPHVEDGHWEMTVDDVVYERPADGVTDEVVEEPAEDPPAEVPADAGKVGKGKAKNKASRN